VRGVHRDGGFAEYAVAPEASAHRIDLDRVPPEAVALVEPYSIGVEVAHRGRVGAGDRVLVLGAGPIGLTVMQVAKLKGAGVMIADLMDRRLARAKRLGADVTVNVARDDVARAVADFTEGEGASVVVDCACTPDTFRQALELAGAAGRVVSLGLVARPSAIASMEIVKKGLDVLGSRLNNRRFPEVIDLFERGSIDPTAILSAVLPCDDAEAAIQQILQHPEDSCKLALRF
jgi:L-gulonate 5-dehydrogenase